jgi:hypothetical protein
MNELIAQVRFHTGITYHQKVYSNLNAEKHDVTLVKEAEGVRVLPNKPMKYATPKFVPWTNILDTDLFPNTQMPLQGASVSPFPSDEQIFKEQAAPKVKGQGRWPKKESA